MRIPLKPTQGEVAILSLLSEGETYGYALNEAIENRGFRNWTDIGFSSIYAILNRLEKKKLITSRLNPSEKGPAKKLYKLTHKGKTILIKSIKLYISEPDRLRSRVDLGAAYITLLPPREAAQCLEHYQTQLQERLTHIKQIYKEQQPLPFGAEIIFDHGFIKGRAEQKWVEKVLRQLKKRQEGAPNE